MSIHKLLCDPPGRITHCTPSVGQSVCPSVRACPIVLERKVPESPKLTWKWQLSIRQ